MKRLIEGQVVEIPPEAIEPTVKILNLAAETLKESWKILPLLYHTSQYGIEPKDIDEHWRHQSNLQYTLLSNWLYVPDVSELSFGSLQVQTDFYQFLNNEKEFLSAFQKQLQAEIVGDYDEYRHDDIRDVLTHVNHALLSVSEKLGLVTKMFHPVLFPPVPPVPAVSAESGNAEVHQSIA